METSQIIAASFTQVRDLPYEVSLAKTGFHEALDLIRKRKRGSCASKHYLLGLAYENLGLEVSYVTYPFYWKEMDVDFPKHIKSLVEIMKICYHLALKISVDGKELFLDASWDPPLERAGFQINRIDGGMTLMNNAVNPCEECIIHRNALERSLYFERVWAERGFTNTDLNFYASLNNWLEEIRKAKAG